MFNDMISVYGADPRQVFLQYRASISSLHHTVLPPLPPLLTYSPPPVLRPVVIKIPKKYQKNKVNKTELKAISNILKRVVRGVEKKWRKEHPKKNISSSEKTAELG